MEFMQRRLNLNLSKALLMLGSLALFGGAVWLWLRPTQVATAEVTAREIGLRILSSPCRDSGFRSICLVRHCCGHLCTGEHRGHPPGS